MLIQDELIAISADVVLTTWIPIAQGLKPAEKGENLSKKHLSQSFKAFQRQGNGENISKFSFCCYRKFAIVNTFYFIRKAHYSKASDMNS